MSGVAPPTRRAWLMNSSLADPRPTEHVYVRSETVTSDGLKNYRHIFRCEETGVERVWGLDGSRPNGSTYQLQGDK